MKHWLRFILSGERQGGWPLMFYHLWFMYQVYAYEWFGAKTAKDVTEELALKRWEDGA